MDEKVICATTDHIEVLSLSVRVHNALKRSNVFDVGELIVLNDDDLYAIRNLGEKGVAEIKDRLGRVELLDASPEVVEDDSGNDCSGLPQILVNLGPPTVAQHEVVKWQQLMLRRQIKARLLHPQIEIEGQTLADLVDTDCHTDCLYEQFIKILAAPITVSQEIEELFKSVPPREIDILVRRSGFERQTLEAISQHVGVTRERVRQIEKQAVARIQNATTFFQFVRIKSAVLFADDLDLSWNDWQRRLVNTGLLGEWSRDELTDFDQLELLVVVCELASDWAHPIEIPECHDFMLRLRRDGMSSTPAKTRALLDRFTNDIERLVMRHLRYSGAVSLEWLVNHNDIELCECDLRLILECKDFFRLDKNWYGSDRYAPHELEYFSVLHRSLLKLFQYCGPLSLRDVYFGIERTLIKVDFPLPPLSVLEQILVKHGYACEDELWFWPGSASEELNSGETAIWETIHELGGVAHHSELMQAILDSGLSGASLHATLRRSPLFDKYDQALYKLRGTHPRHSDVERARSAANRTRVDLTVERDTYGNITVAANLGILAIANGTIVSERIPNLIGDWQCCWGETESSEIRVTHNEIRGLLGVMRFLECDLGDRISLTFNVIDRTVTMHKLGDDI